MPLVRLEVLDFGWANVRKRDIRSQPGAEATVRRAAVVSIDMAETTT